MYLEFFGLKEHPFQLTPDSDFLYMSEPHARAKAYMDYAIWMRDGFVVVTGEVGAGKTTLLQKLISEFDDSIVVAKIFQTQLNDVEFLQAVLLEFGLKPFAAASKVELMDMLTQFLMDNFMQSRQLVLIVDEAQNLSPQVLEEIRMLSGLETRKEKVLHVVLVGQPELNDMLDSPQMEQLMQRVRLRCHIGALAEVEMADYIAHRLGVAGSARPLFAPGTLPLIHEYTGGIPRLINTLCDMALVCAFNDEVEEVTPAVLSVAIEELRWRPYRERVAAREKRVASVALPRLNEPMLELLHALVAQLAGLNQKLDRIAAMEGALSTIAAGLTKRERRAAPTGRNSFTAQKQKVVKDLKKKLSDA